MPADAEALRVLAFVDDPAHYSARVRSSIPFNALRQQKVVEYRALSYFNATDVMKGKPQIGKHFLEAYLYPADVVQWSLCSSVTWLKFMDLIQQAGKPFVMDLDDDLWAVSPYSNCYLRWGTEPEVVVEVLTTSEGTGAVEGKKYKLWDSSKVYVEDGKDVKYDPEANKKGLDIIEAAIRKADAVTVTTEKAAERFRAWNPNVIVLPNTLEARCWQPGKFHRGDGLYRIGWYGGSSHKPDLGTWTGAGEALGRFARAHPDVRVVIGGVLLPEVRHHVPPKQIEFHEWICADAHPYQVSCMGLDHGLAPVCDMPFNYSKSPLKWTELCALGVPCSASNHTPYKEAVRDGVDGFLIEDSADAWHQNMERVYTDQMLRARVGHEGRKRFERDFESTGQSHLWMEAYTALYRSGPRCNPAPQLVEA
jgi:hypothetical protein